MIVTEVPDTVLDSGKVETVTGVAGPREEPTTTKDDPWAMVVLKSAALPAKLAAGRNDWAVRHGVTDKAEHRNPRKKLLFESLVDI